MFPHCRALLSFFSVTHYYCYTLEQINDDDYDDDDDDNEDDDTANK